MRIQASWERQTVLGTTGRRLVGGHVSAAGGLGKAIARGDDIGAEIVQIFSNSPRGWKAQRISLAGFEGVADAISAVATRVERVVSHASYLINLATPEADLYEKSSTLLAETMYFAGSIGISSVVLHVGSHRGAGFMAQLPQVRGAIQAALDVSEGVDLLIENSAGAGDSVGSSLEEIAAVLGGVDSGGRLGMCLDTQHLFAAGFDYLSADGVKAFADEIYSVLPAGALRCIHLNDSKVRLGAHVDRHENLGEGEIGIDALAGLVNHPLLVSTDVVLETPGDGDGPRRIDVELARSFVI